MLLVREVHGLYFVLQRGGEGRDRWVNLPLYEPMHMSYSHIFWEENLQYSMYSTQLNYKKTTMML